VDECAIDGERDALRDHLQQLDVLALEDSWRQRANVDHADHASFDDQRRSEQRLDALLAEDGIEEERMIDVLDATER